MTPAVGLHNFRYGAQRQFKHLVFVGQKVHTHTHKQRHIYTHDVPQTVGEPNLKGIIPLCY